jgi:2-dehydro-3-deoxygluconokinase
MARIVCFGEMLLRLGAPGHEPLLRSPVLEASFGGAEANVALAAAGLGLHASMVTVLPDNPIGDACVGELRRHGVGIEGVVRQPGRMGLYFLTRGALLRPAEVTYDRAGSAFAAADPGMYDWRSLLSGADWLHVSGITAALGEPATRALLAVTETANELGVAVSFDCNYRPSLWRGRERQAASVLRELAGRARLLFANAHDASLLFDVGSTAAKEPAEALSAAATAAFAACAGLAFVASTNRVVRGPDQHDLIGHVADRHGAASSRSLAVERVVDRIGSGDAYAAGVIYGISQGFERARIAEFAVTLAALKHGMPGDFILARADDVWMAMEGGQRDVRR